MKEPSPSSIHCKDFGVSDDDEQRFGSRDCDVKPVRAAEEPDVVPHVLGDLVLLAPHAAQDDHQILLPLKLLHAADLDVLQILALQKLSDLELLLVVGGDHPDLRRGNFELSVVAQSLHVVLHNSRLVGVEPRWTVPLPLVLPVDSVEHHWELSPGSWQTTPPLQATDHHRIRARLQSVVVEHFRWEFDDGGMGAVVLNQHAHAHRVVSVTSGILLCVPGIRGKQLTRTHGGSFCVL
mmetsp:Transcript_13198/g.18024  ORF Transcript_13198/g.18024 Transcript_13198/m.18024 type:complete len:237 (-) Transcript_13198:2130-2840(-)